MPRSLPTRRMLRHHLMLHRSAWRDAQGGDLRPLRNSDLVLAILGVALLGGLALAAALSLAAGATAP